MRDRVLHSTSRVNHRTGTNDTSTILRVDVDEYNKRGRRWIP